jgi:hypothetical protein
VIRKKIGKYFSCNVEKKTIFSLLYQKNIIFTYYIMEKSHKILGLDLGTNSIGWAIVENEGDEFQLVDQGARIFSEGVKSEKELKVHVQLREHPTEVLGK